MDLVRNFPSIPIFEDKSVENFVVDRRGGILAERKEGGLASIRWIS